MTGNTLLDALPQASVAALVDAGEVVSVPAAAVVQPGGQPVQHVHFPVDGVLAVQATASGSPVGVAVVGREGAVGPPVPAGRRACRR